MATFCLDCRRRIERGSRCARCERRRFPNSPDRMRGRSWQQTRAGVLQAFGYRCAECGATGVPLQVHHRDHDHTHNDLGNLLPLCRGCHRRAS
jgi:5-methylcytosine-specific restriction endonuclease McrA